MLGALPCDRRRKVSSTWRTRWAQHTDAVAGVRGQCLGAPPMHAAAALLKDTIWQCAVEVTVRLV